MLVSFLAVILGILAKTSDLKIATGPLPCVLKIGFSYGWPSDAVVP